MADMNSSILIVDDYKTMLRIIRNILSQFGFFNVDEATNGSLALLKLKEKKYDLVIADWYMEPTNGLELLQHMKSDNMLKNIPFIMVTAESNAENVLKAKQAGVDNYIVKPFSNNTLRQKIINTLGEF
jgi:two-component system, chemotaxis family, chemotaxis protein CheY